MPYIVDGYNLLRFVQKREEFTSFSDVQVCRAVSDYLTCVKDHGAVIFDGIGPRDKSAFEGMPNLEVCFAGAKIEADEVIEQRIADNSAPKNLVVVSTDRRIRTSASRRKAKPLTSEVFWQILLEQLEKAANRPAREPTQKRHGLTNKETEFWLKRFKLDK